MFELLMKQYIDKNMHCKLMPSFTTEIPGFTYTHTPISSGPVNESQYEIKVVDDDLDRALQKRNELIALLNVDISKPSLVQDNLVFRASLAGGGQIFSDSIQVWELSLIFIVKWRIQDGK